MLKALLVGLLLAQSPGLSPSRVQSRTLSAPDVGTIAYGLSVPEHAVGPTPLIVALHPGGERIGGRGMRFMGQVALPALRDLNAVLVAPDCPGRSWIEPLSERAILALVAQTRSEFAIDPKRILVTGFSMGGRGTWFMLAGHSDLFTAAIPVAGSMGDAPLERLGLIPTYIVHSRDDQVVPFAPVEQTAKTLREMGRPVRFEKLEGVGHFEMGRYIGAIRRAGQWVVEQWGR